MKICRTIAEIRRETNPSKRKEKNIGFVPTMGALHEGHACLLRQCRRENDVSILSIFVNPIQFGKNEDFSKYPRQFEKDEKLAKKEKVDIMFHPSVEEMYPDEILTKIDVGALSKNLCGKFRPGHFQGVATVVAKLFNIVSPTRVYFGQKDAQQAFIIQRMLRDLNFPIDMIIAPTIRANDGLALSSRNIYLSTQERKESPVLFQSLKEAQTLIEKGERSAAKITRRIQSMIQKKSSGKIQYIECVDTQTLNPVSNLKGNVLIALAVFFGKTRLIDNMIVDVA